VRLQRAKPSRQPEAILAWCLGTRVDENTCTLQSVNRTEDGELPPNIEEVQIKEGVTPSCDQ
jgi:hypothetical protein